MCTHETHSHTRMRTNTHTHTHTYTHTHSHTRTHIHTLARARKEGVTLYWTGRSLPCLDDMLEWKSNHRQQNHRIYSSSKVKQILYDNVGHICSFNQFAIHKPFTGRNLIHWSSSIQHSILRISKITRRTLGKKKQQPCVLCVKCPSFSSVACELNNQESLN